MKLVLVLVSLVAVINGYTIRSAPLLKERPKWLSACRRNDPNLNSCLNDLFERIFPHLAIGIPEINVDKFEPLDLDRVSVSRTAGPITLTGSLFNLHIMGPSNATPSWTDFSAEKKHWNFGLDIPFLDIKSQYNLKGNILVLPLVGNGNCDLKLTDIRTKVTTNISFPIVEGKEICRIDDMKVKFSLSKMRVMLYNLFNGNKLLGNTVNAFINQHGSEVVAELEESISESLADIFKKLMNNIFSKIPTDLWFLSDEEYKNYKKD